jgi:hypothetical protein
VSALGMGEWMVSVVDPGCECCSFVPIRSFPDEAGARAFVAGRSRPRNCSIEDVGDDE